MGKLTNTFLCMALLVAGLMGITLSLPLQAPALILLGVSGLVGLALVLRRQYDLRLIVLVTLALAYFLIRAWMSPVVDLANEDLFLIIAAGLYNLMKKFVDESGIQYVGENQRESNILPNDDVINVRDK